jgi:hypothetical protein
MNALERSATIRVPSGRSNARKSPGGRSAMLLALGTLTPARSLGIDRNPVQESAGNCAEGGGVGPTGGRAAVAAAGQFGEDLVVAGGAGCGREGDENNKATVARLSMRAMSKGDKEEPPSLPSSCHRSRLVCGGDWRGASRQLRAWSTVGTGGASSVSVGTARETSKGKSRSTKDWPIAVVRTVS